MIRGIIFDCFGVLCHGSLDYLRSLAPAGRAQEITDLSRSYDYGYIDQADYFNGVGQVIGKTATEVATICQSQHVRNDTLLAYIRRLRPRYKIALLSNVGRGFMQELFTPNELTELFDAVVLSSEVGMAKPSQAIFDLTASKLALDSGECVMVDDIPGNVEGAVMVGMQGVVYGNFDQMTRDLQKLGVQDA